MTHGISLQRVRLYTNLLFSIFLHIQVEMLWNLLLNLPQFPWDSMWNQK